MSMLFSQVTPSNPAYTNKQLSGQPKLNGSGTTKGRQWQQYSQHTRTTNAILFRHNPLRSDTASTHNLSVVAAGGHIHNYPQ
jgi:hypothetical protein